MKLKDACSWENCRQGKKQLLELAMELWAGSKLGKEYVKAVYCHPAYLTYMQQNARLDETQAGIKIARRNINIIANEYSGLISFRTDFISLQSKGLSRVFSNTTVQKHQFFGTQLSSQSNSHIHT